MAEKTIATLEQDLRAEHDLHLRALADFDNYRRRIERERSRLGKEALRDFIIELLDVVDDLERILNFADKEPTSFMEAVSAVHRKLLALLAKENVRPFDSIGEPFDPSLHEVASTTPAGEKTQGAVVQELRRGYKWKDDLLRPARVVVAM